jgi:hypothetical protein
VEVKRTSGILVLLGAVIVGACTGSPGVSQRQIQAQPSPSATRSLSSQGLWQRLKDRPFQAPSVPAGAPCPKTSRGLHAKQVHRISADVLKPGGPGIALGWGPVYPLFFFPLAFYDPRKASGKGAVIRPTKQPGTVWASIKTLWIAQGTFHGHVLVRGRQLRGTHELRFGAGTRPGPSFLQLSSANAAIQRDGSRNWTGGTWVATPGCYALQLDDSIGSQLIVIEIGQPLDA